MKPFPFGPFGGSAWMKMWHSPSLQPLFNREPDDEAMDFRIFRIYYDKHRQTLQKRRIKELVMTFLSQVMLGTLQPQRRPPNPQPPAGALRHLCRSRRRWPRAPRSCHLSTAAAGTSWDHGPAGKVFQKICRKSAFFLGEIC